MKKKFIFIPLYRNFGLRYIESFKLIEQLSKRYKVVLFVDKKRKNIFKEYFNNDDLIFESLELEELKKNKKFIKIRTFLKIFRKFVNGENNYKNKSIDLWRIKYQKQIINHHYYFFHLISAIFRKFKFLRNFLIYLDQKFDYTNIYEKYFHKYKPEWIIITSFGYDLDQYFVRNSKEFNCKVISIVFSWDNPSTKGYKLSNSDYYLVWNKQMKKDLITFQDIEPDKIFECGAAHWDTYFKDNGKKAEIREKFFLKNEIKKDKKIILFLTSGPRDFFNTYKIINQIMQIISKKDFILIVRMHPLFKNDDACIKYTGNKSSYFEDQLKNSYKEKILFVNPKLNQFGINTNEAFYPTEDIEELKKLYSISDIMLNQYSTSLIEGCIFNLPIINLGIGKYRDTENNIKVYEFHNHLWELKKLNIITYLYDLNFLNDKIEKILKNNKSHIYYEEKIIDFLVGPNKGKAGKFTLNKIIDLIEAN